MNKRELKAKKKKLEQAALALETALLMALHVEPLEDPIWLGAGQLAQARDLALEALRAQLALIDAELSGSSMKHVAA